MKEVPDWVDREQYPYQPDTLRTPAGELKYVDVGEGPVVLLLHGNPTWSFMYREAIETLRPRYRCLAPDHIGFGLSDKPEDWGYRPWDHASNINRLLEALNVDEFDLVIHDWGGPIGLSVALEDPQRLNSLSIINTWMWSMSHRMDAWFFSNVLGSRVGRYLISDWDLFTDLIMKWGVSRTDSLSDEIHRHYQKPFSNDVTKRGVWQFPSDIVGATGWLEELWAKRESIREKPALINWGMKDPAFNKSELDRWDGFLKDVRINRYPEASHYLMEDEGPAVSRRLEAFLDELHSG